MATYTQDVLSGSKIRDPKESMRELQDLESGTQAVQRQITGGPVTGLNRFQRQGLQNQWLGQESQRRLGSNQAAFGLGGQIDEREAGIANQLSSLYDKYRNTQADAQQQQAQGTLALDQDTKEALAGISQKKNEFDFGLYKNQAERNDALTSLWAKGTAEESLQNAAINNQIKMQDIDQYFKLINNQLEQDFEDYKHDYTLAWSKYQREVTSRAANYGAIFGGLFTVGGAIVGGIYGGPAGAVAGGTMGGSMGESLGNWAGGR